MLDEASGQDWVSWRDPRISRPIPRLGYVTECEAGQAGAEFLPDT
jgi:hypothetical protein